MVPVTSNHWPYHTDLLVFCLKCRFSPFCECLNYYYNITNNHWAILEKIQTEWFEDTRFWKKNMTFLALSLCPWKFWTKQSFTRIPWNCVSLFGSSKAKNEDLWKFNMSFFWSILEIPLLYQSAPRISTWYFLNIPEKFSYIYDIYMQIYMQYICYMNIIIDIIFNTIFDFGSVCIMEINLSLRGDLNCILL